MVACKLGAVNLSTRVGHHPSTQMVRAELEGHGVGPGLGRVLNCSERPLARSTGTNIESEVYPLGPHASTSSTHRTPCPA